MQMLTDNPFYTFVILCSGLPIPSTRSGYRNVANGVVINPESQAVHRFRSKIREALRSRPQFTVPFKGRVMISLALGLNPLQYTTCDIDNMVKSLLDALKTVVYDDDLQVDVLHVVKYKSDCEQWNLGIRALPDNDPLWHFPPLYLESPMGL
jgi:Holliday junction resolvase RusA-like endonuclease